MKKEKTKLNLKQEEFCKMYTSNDRDMFGNGVQSYIEIYEPDTSKSNWYKTACASASQLLSNIKVINKINELLEEQGFNDENVEKQHLFILNQHVNIPAKMKAIDSYYKLKGKNAADKVEHSGEVKTIHSEDTKNKKEILDLAKKYEEDLKKELLK